MEMKDTLRYELPEQGITLLGYIVRRMHKTAWLLPIPRLLASGETARALAHAGLYAVAASTSFGRAYYQPRFNSAGDTIAEPDPATGAAVTAVLEATEPHYRISYHVEMPDGSRFQGNETITGTTVGLRGLGMPAPSQFKFSAGGYEATMTGLLTSELALSLLGRTRIRAYGSLDGKDNAGNAARMQVDRSRSITVRVNGLPVELPEPVPAGGP